MKTVSLVIVFGQAKNEDYEYAEDGSIRVYVFDDPDDAEEFAEVQELRVDFYRTVPVVY